MKTRILILTLAASLFSAYNYAQESNEEAQNVHQDPTHNFTLHRLIVLNDKNEMLMNREDYVWAPPSSIYDSANMSPKVWRICQAPLVLKLPRLSYMGILATNTTTIRIPPCAPIMSHAM